jgi:hypothetical protein
MSPSENCPDCGGKGYVLKGSYDNTTEAPCHCTKELDGILSDPVNEGLLLHIAAIFS